MEKDVEGRVTVRQTGDHLGRAGLGWGGGVGLLVGLSSGDGTAANARCVAKGSPGIASAAAPAAPAFRTSLREIPGDPLAIAHPLPRSPDLPPD